MAKRRKRKAEEETVEIIDRCEADRERAARRKAYLAELDRREALPRVEVWTTFVAEDGRRFTRIEIVPCEGRLSDADLSSSVKA